jgi:hypothetical protein
VVIHYIIVKTEKGYKDMSFENQNKGFVHSPLQLALFSNALITPNSVLSISGIWPFPTSLL